MKIKILFGLEATGGGALKHLVYLVTRLNKDVFDITVILSDARDENVGKEIAKIKEFGAKVITFPMCRNINTLKDLYSLVGIIALLKKNKIDIVHAHSSKAGGLFRLAAWFCKVDHIYYTPHCFYFQGKTGLKRFSFMMLEKLLAKITTGIIVSESEQKEIIKNKIAPISKIFNINNAIDFDEYPYTKRYAEVKKKYGLSYESTVVASVGRLTHQKDWETFIFAANEVIKELAETEFLIVGEGELYHEINKLIFKLSLEDKIFLTGYVENVDEIYGVIDIYVNTSLWEGLPYVILEAMRYKKPIVATDTGNGSVILHKETGFINPVKDYKSIARQIIFLIKNKAVGIEMGRKGNELLIEKYSFEKFIKEHEMIYKKSIVVN